jgi:hypothetical protein
VTAYHASTRCPMCQAVVIVPKREGLAARLLRALALASHVRALHTAKADWR